MPELPEVETTTRREIAPYVIGQKIACINLVWEGIVRYPSPEEFIAGVTGQTVTEISRRGKYLFFHLESGQLMNVHLKMTGSLLIKPEGTAPGKFVRAVIGLSNGTEIHFRDPRKFGVLKLLDQCEEASGPLGPEPLEKDFTLKYLSEGLARRKTPVKAVLLDQGFIAGIGNMYADEALFEARINPNRLASSLSKEEVTRLRLAIIDGWKTACLTWAPVPKPTSAPPARPGLPTTTSGSPTSGARTAPSAASR